MFKYISRRIRYHNESCHTWLRHVTYKWVVWHNKSIRTIFDFFCRFAACCLQCSVWHWAASCSVVLIWSLVSCIENLQEKSKIAVKDQVEQVSADFIHSIRTLSCTDPAKMDSVNICTNEYSYLPLFKYKIYIYVYVYIYIYIYVHIYTHK